MKNILNIYQWNSNIENGSFNIITDVSPDKTYIPEKVSWRGNVTPEEEKKVISMTMQLPSSNKDICHNKFAYPYT